MTDYPKLPAPLSITAPVTPVWIGTPRTGKSPALAAVLADLIRRDPGLLARIGDGKAADLFKENEQ
ncbi:hypothetical protein AB0H73_09210 [Streptomyces olivoreticuli]